MNGEMVFSRERLAEILEKEFLIPSEDWEDADWKRAYEALKIYESIEDFLRETHWREDNPECDSEEYLVKYRICRWIDNKFVYFSRLLWEKEHVHWG